MEPAVPTNDTIGHGPAAPEADLYRSWRPVGASRHGSRVGEGDDVVAELDEGYVVITHEAAERYLPDDVHLKRMALSPVTAPGRRVLPHFYRPSKGEHH
jgi:hypothetical protein